LVTFNCGGPAEIAFAHPITLTADTTIDGGTLGAVTLDGGGVTHLLSTTPGVQLHILNLDLRHGDRSGG
jgi:hypothetical protein